MFDPENSMVSGYGWGEREAARRHEARAEWEWEHADDELDEMYAEQMTEEELKRLEFDYEEGEE